MSKPEPDPNDASRRMHDYLLNKQRRKEDYWLRKYGRVLVPPADRPAGPPGGQLPPLIPPGGGRPAMFQANGPLSSFPSKGAPPMNPDRMHRAGAIPYHPAVVLPPLKHTAMQDAGISPSGSAKERRSPINAFGAPETFDTPAFVPAAVAQEEHLMPFPQLSALLHAPPSLPPLHQHQLSPLVAVEGRALLGHPGMGGYSQEASTLSVQGPSPKVAHRKQAVRDLQMELSVLKAIKGREDVLDRLRVACEKLDGSFGGSSPLVLSQTDPLVRLFYRLVGTMRQRTLDAVEAIAAWQRKTASQDAFVYYGVDYLSNIGADLKFLDQQAFLSTRLVQGRAVDDPFLLEVTPDGIPIEEATTCDLRRGGMRFSSESLRIRAARKVLANYAARHRPLPAVPSSPITTPPSLLEVMQYAASGKEASPLTVTAYNATVDRAPAETSGNKALGALTEENKALGALSEESADQATARMQASSEAALEAAVLAEKADWEGGEDQEGEGEEEEEEEDEEGAEAEESRREPGEVSEPAAVQSPPEEVEVEEEEVVKAAVHALAVGAVQSVLEKEALRLEVVLSAAPAVDDTSVSSAQALEDAAVVAEAVEEHPALATAAVEDADAEEADWEQEQERQDDVLFMSMLAEGELAIDLDDGQFLDYMINAIVSSIEEPYVSTMKTGTFTVSGWEIDRQLDRLILGIEEGKDGEEGPGTPLSALTAFVPNSGGQGTSPFQSLLSLRAARDKLRSSRPTSSAAAEAAPPRTPPSENQPGSAAPPRLNQSVAKVSEQGALKDGPAIDSLVDDLVQCLDQSRLGIRTLQT